MLYFFSTQIINQQSSFKDETFFILKHFFFFHFLARLMGFVETFTWLLWDILEKQISKLLCLTTQMKLKVMRCSRIWPYPFCCQHDDSCLVLEGRCQPQFLFHGQKMNNYKVMILPLAKGLFCSTQECPLDKITTLIKTLVTRTDVKMMNGLI